MRWLRAYVRSLMWAVAMGIVGLVARVFDHD